MKQKNIYRGGAGWWIAFVFTVLSGAGCGKDFLEKYPLSSLATNTFWKSEEDAMMGLTGVYRASRSGLVQHYWDAASDNGAMAARTRLWILTNGSLNASNTYISDHWIDSYKKISAANYFLENIGAVAMSENEKQKMIAEVRFIRAYQYFWLSQHFGGVPLVTKVLTINEANTLNRDTKETVNGFVETEMKEAAAQLPWSRPAAEDGRIVKAAALAMLGRLQMAEERWPEAAATYKTIIDAGVHEIDSRYKELFLASGKGSKEMIYVQKNMQDVLGVNTQQVYPPQQFGGQHLFDPFSSLVLAYDMEDGLPADQSPLFDPDNPYDHRDPRLYATIFVPGSQWKGMTYQSHPDLTNMDNMKGTYMGYALKKWVDEGYTGNVTAYGGDYVLIRYAEVLLSYLESKFEADNGVVSQQLLDETVNHIRARAAVSMPPIQVADLTRERLRNERRIELAWEGLRYWDILRWKIAHVVCTGPQTGIKLTNDPANYTDYLVDENGYYVAGVKAFRNPENYLWPIPQAELDINPSLGQNNGYN